MDKSQLKYSQLAKLCIMVLLLLVTPFLSTSMRTPYLYFLLNLLIIVVGAEAGILSSSTSPEDKKHQPVPVVFSSSGGPVITKPISSTADSTSTTTTTLVETTPNKKTTDSTSTTTTTLVETSPKKETTDSLTISNNVKTAESGHGQSTETKVQLKKTMGKSVSEKTCRLVRVHKVKRSPSTPSLFFIGGCDTDHSLDDKSSTIVEEDMEEEVEEVEALSGQELYTKAEMFIGNFYKQLKIQREDSWKKLHDFYHKAF